MILKKGGLIVVKIMKRILMISALLIAIASIFFFQCEKTETLDFSKKVEAQLGGKTWYAITIKINHQEYKFKEPTIVIFEKGNIKIKPLGEMTCVTQMTYASPNILVINKSFSCIGMPNIPINEPTKELIRQLHGEVHYDNNKHEAILSTANTTIELSTKWDGEPIVVDLLNTNWALSKLIMMHKDIGIEFTQKPNIKFQQERMIVDLPKFSCQKTILYPDDVVFAFADSNFTCEPNTCCANNDNRILLDNLTGFMSIVLYENNYLLLKNDEGAEFHLHKIKEKTRPDAISADAQ